MARLRPRRNKATAGPFERHTWPAVLGIHARPETALARAAALVEQGDLTPAEVELLRDTAAGGQLEEIPAAQARMLVDRWDGKTKRIKLLPITEKERS